MDRDENMRLWDPLSHTDPKHTSPFKRPGGFSGTAIKPIWTYMRLTELFGPMGTGWGSEEPKFNIIDAKDEVLVFCVLQCWYKETPESEKAILWGIGGDRVVQNRSGLVHVSDEAYKSAYTDALGNAFMRIGSSADIYMGMFSDSKYLMQVREFYDNTRAIQAQIEGKNSNPNSQ